MTSREQDSKSTIVVARNADQCLFDLYRTSAPMNNDMVRWLNSPRRYNLLSSLSKYPYFARLTIEIELGSKEIFRKP